MNIFYHSKRPCLFRINRQGVGNGRRPPDLLLGSKKRPQQQIQNVREIRDAIPANQKISQRLIEFGRNSMATETSLRRIDVLSKPKSLPVGFIEDKRSVYWDCKIAKDWTNSPFTTVPNLSPRLEELIKPKNLPKEYIGDRPNPIWQVTPAAMKATPTNRVESLSHPKPFHKDYEPPKSVFSLVSPGAKSANPSKRIENLARHKNSAALPTNQSLWDWSEWETSVSRAAKTTSPTDHVLRLSLPKKTAGGYKECRGVQWTISETTLKALPSLRIQQLARPKSRSQFMDHYDDDAYKVSSAAKHAQSTPRIQELCVPLPRKVKQKKLATGN